ncbi:MAG: calcineurin-like phosphoesterase family protein [Pseudomonadota bacterium]
MRSIRTLFRKDNQLLCAGTLFGVLALASCTTLSDPSAASDETWVGMSAEPQDAPLFSNYQGGPNITTGDDPNATSVSGLVFEDLNRNSVFDAGEPGVPGVKVSNGLDVVTTDAVGGYTLSARDDMAVFVIQPSGYQVPHNRDWIPQIAYQHKPAGTPKQLRYGGLPPTGPMPSAIDFPLIQVEDSDQFQCGILGDTQSYSNTEVGYVRDSVVDDILALSDTDRPDCLIALGDVLGDDFGMLPRLADVIATVEAPQWWVHGNHDFDFDADRDADSADSWRNLYGPNYYAFEIGQVVFVVLDNVVYPCGPEDAETPGREFCVSEDRKLYNGRIPDDQMQFVENLLAETDDDKLIVFAHHIPFLTYVNQNTAPHQTDNVGELYALVGDRPALSLSGHTHTLENMSPGDRFSGWKELVGIDALPFRHIVAGAVSGAWFQGDFDIYGVPMSLQRLGAPRGWLDLEFDGNAYVETYFGTNLDPDQRMWVSINTPGFRDWYRQIMAWWNSPRDARDPLPPRSINDLPDVKLLTPLDLAGGSYLTANVWDGSSETQVEAEIAGAVFPMERTQPATGEGLWLGAFWADPFAIQRQLSVARYALQSRSGEARNQGWEVFQGAQFGPAPPQPQAVIADRNMHLWRLSLPSTLPIGAHTVTITATDRHGRTSTEHIVIEVRDTRPPARFRSDVFNAFENGPPIR